MLLNILPFLYFRYKIIRPSDREWGNRQDDGTVTGMIGVVSREEGDIAVDSITISGRLLTAVKTCL